MTVYEKIYLTPVSGDGTAKYYFNSNTTIDAIEGWGMPARSLSTTKIWNRDGWIKNNGGFDGQDLNIDFYMECSSYSGLMDEKDALNAFLSQDELKIVREIKNRYMVGAFKSDSWVEKAEDEGIRVAGRITFLCCDPFKYCVDATDRIFKGFTQSGQYFTKQVYVSGNYHTHPYIHLSGVVGSIENFTITNITNGTNFSIDNITNEGKFALIDNDEKDVYASGGISVLKYTAPQTSFIRLDPGANLLMLETLDTNSGLFSATMEVWYRDRWL